MIASTFITVLVAFISFALADSSFVTVCTSSFTYTTGDLTGVLLTSCSGDNYWQATVCQDFSVAIQSYTYVLTTYWEDSTSSATTETSLLTIFYPLLVPGGQAEYSFCGQEMELTKVVSLNAALDSNVMTSIFVTSYLPVSVTVSTDTSTETITETGAASTVTNFETLTETVNDACTSIATVTETQNEVITAISTVSETLTVVSIVFETVTEIQNEECTAIGTVTETQTEVSIAFETVTESLTYSIGSDEVVTVYTEGPTAGTSTYTTCI